MSKSGPAGVVLPDIIGECGESGSRGALSPDIIGGCVEVRAIPGLTARNHRRVWGNHQRAGGGRLAVGGGRLAVGVRGRHTAKGWRPEGTGVQALNPVTPWASCSLDSGAEPDPAPRSNVERDVWTHHA